MGIENPVVVMPLVYELPLGMWQWCKLGDVCAVASAVASISEMSFNLSAEKLINNFVALTRTNKGLAAGKFFRYSLDGHSMAKVSVPVNAEGKGVPPYVPFELPIERPYSLDMFVPVGWAKDTLRAIRQGALAIADFGEVMVGFRPGGEPFLFEGKMQQGMMMVRIPERVREHLTVADIVGE